MHYSHRLSQTRIHQIVGTFILVPLLILGAVLFMVAKSENIFEDRFQITTLFSEGHGLKPGQPVMLLGIQIGKVVKVEFTDQNDAMVTMEIRKKYQDKIRQNSVAKMGKSGGFVGDPQIEITVGNKSQPIVPPDGHIEAEEPFNVAELLAEVKPLIETVKKMVARVDQITQDVHTTVKTSGEAVSNVRDATQRLPETMDNVKQTTTTVRDAARTAAVEIPRITADVRKSVARVGDAVEDVKTTTAKLPAVVDSAKGAVDNLQTMTGDLKDVVRKDVPPLVRSAQGTVDDVSEIVAGAKQTFPLDVFAAKGKGSRSEGSAHIVPRSLRRDDLVKE